MWINDEASSSTLVEVLAFHDHKRHAKINWIHEEKKNLQSKSVQKGLGMTKGMFLLSTTPPNKGFTKEKHVFIIVTMVFSCADRSTRVHSIALRALERNVRVFKVLAAWHLMIALGFQLMWACAQLRLLGLSPGALDHSTCVLDHIARELLHPFAYFSPFNRILMLVTCSTLKHQKLTKILEKKHS